MTTDDALALLSAEYDSAWSLGLHRDMTGWVASVERPEPDFAYRKAWGETPGAAANALLDGNYISRLDMETT